MINNNKIIVESSVKLLGIIIDNKLEFNDHIAELCKRARNKLAALKRLRPFISKDKASLLASTFVLSQFNYSPLVWMFCSKENNDKINKIHEKTLRIVYLDYNSSFNTLLCKSDNVTVHTKNLQVLMTEVYKFVNGFGPSFMSEIFNLANEKYNLRTKQRLVIPKTKSVHHGYQSVSFRAGVIWNQLPNSYKTIATIPAFKQTIKQWKGDSCHCRICC